MKNSLSKLIDYESSRDIYGVENRTWLSSTVHRAKRILDLQSTEREEKSEMNTIGRFRKMRIRDQLEDAGLSHFDLAHPESRHLDKYLHPTEKIFAAIRGRIKDVGSVLIVATNLRILYVHILPLVSDFEEVPYGLVSGIQCKNIRGLWSSVTLETRSHNFEVNFVHPRAAQRFMNFIETASIDTTDAAFHTIPRFAHL